MISSFLGDEGVGGVIQENSTGEINLKDQDFFSVNNTWHKLFDFSMK